MITIHHPGDMRDFADASRREGKRIGLVPTMGALHAGHLSLVKHARAKADVVVVSIFVNPAQFGPAEDFQKYPRPWDEDCRRLQAAGVDVLFAPQSPEMYPAEYMTYVAVEGITATLEGAIRPAHFRGVTTVVLKFFNIVNPHIAVFGQKDAQQAIVIKRMAADLNLALQLIVAPTIRESDGVAMSSRNIFLTPAERKEAPLIYRGLCGAADAFHLGERSAAGLRALMAETFAIASSMEAQYVAIVDTVTLAPVDHIAAKALIAVACRMRESGTRLIDNVVVGGEL
jgi:pantoate--beta-alanine ligase